MKNLFFTLAIAIASTTFGQMPDAMTSRGGYDVNSGTETNEALSVDGIEFPVFTTEGGSKFVKATSPRTGNEYAVWVFTPTDETFEGRTVYTTKRGTPCVYKLTKAGFPYPNWLDTDE